VWLFQLTHFASGECFRANNLADLKKEVSVCIALYFRCFSVEIVLPSFRSDHRSPVHNSPLKKLAFRKEYVQDTVRQFLH